MIQTLSKWFPVRFTRTRHEYCRGLMPSATEATSRWHTILPIHLATMDAKGIHLARMDAKAIGLKRFICFTLGFLRNWYYEWTFPGAWDGPAIKQEVKETGEHWPQLWCSWLKCSTLRPSGPGGLNGFSLKKHEVTSCSFTHTELGPSRRQAASHSLL